MGKTYDDVEPAMVGKSAKAWALAIKPTLPAHAATVAHWLIRSPHFHPAWDRWVVIVVHLRDMPGVKPASKQYQKATHELIIMALDPEQEPFDPGTPPAPIKFLTPPDVVVQFHVERDADANKMCDLAVRAICDGKASPDSDYRSYWIANIKSTSAHLRGEHGTPKDPLH